MEKCDHIIRWMLGSIDCKKNGIISCPLCDVTLNPLKIGDNDQP